MLRIPFIFFTCTNLAHRWAPEAVRTADEALTNEEADFTLPVLSCASQTARLLGADEQQAVTVAGLAGGIGLSGEGCGALGAAIWLNTLDWLREDPQHQAYPNPHAEATLKRFREASGGKMLCQKITGRQFASIDEHTEFVQAGGCEHLLAALADQPAEDVTG